MKKIDAHQHFWKFDPVRDNWISDDMKTIRRDFMPVDLQPVLNQSGFDGCVAIQADQSEMETEFLISLAQTNPFIKGIVGWVNLLSDEVDERLSFYKQSAAVKGFRHILQSEPQRDLMLHPAFRKGLTALGKYNFTYDLLILPDQLLYAAKLASYFPNQMFVVDHLAKPDIRQGHITGWKHDIKSLAQYPNVYCKVSGVVTEADWKHWNKQDFTPYLDVLLDVFGTSRLMFGSDWPVCLVAASYPDTLAIAADYFSSFSLPEQEAVFGENAIRFYHL